MHVNLRKRSDGGGRSKGGDDRLKGRAEGRTVVTKVEKRQRKSKGGGKEAVRARKAVPEAEGR